jgi:hypothetical protein
VHRDQLGAADPKKDSTLFSTPAIFIDQLSMDAISVPITFARSENNFILVVNTIKLLKPV